tara:strand:- start:2095 stop:2355 length:261 start_codon:yes stop_codon:yes gene_type:complete
LAVSGDSIPVDYFTGSGLPMTQKEKVAANDNGAGMEEAEQHLRSIARAIGRHIAREHFRVWERRRQRVANDNQLAASEEEGQSPEG